MRGKRSKQYRKLMHQYHLSFGFREPYQVLVDAQMLQDADRFKMDLVGGLERTLHGQVKPMITQCSMRHLYAKSSEPGVSYLIDKAKTYERRRCGHLPSDYPEPLSTQACLTSVVDPKGNKTNKHRYVVASQELDTRKAMREILGVPLVYIHRSVMIMEPMAGATAENREREEKAKFRDGLKRGSGSLKRKREDDEEGPSGGNPVASDAEATKKKKRGPKGPKGPNPLAVKKPKKRSDVHGAADSGITRKVDKVVTEGDKLGAGEGTDSEQPGATKKKRRRKHKPGPGEAGTEAAAEAAEEYHSE